MQSTKEEWRPVPDFGGHYLASSRGRVKVKRRTVERVNRWGEVATYTYRSRILRPHTIKSKNGTLYKYVSIGWDGNRRSVGVHIMVLLAFRGQRPSRHHCGCHNNSISTDNRPENLRWDTHHGNMQDRKRNGMYLRGEDHPMAKLTNAEAHSLRSSGLNGRQAAEAYGISKTQAYRILNGERGGAA